MGTLNLETMVENDNGFEIVNDHPVSKKQYFDYQKQGEPELAAEVYEQLEPSYQ